MTFIKHQNIRGVLLLDTNLWLKPICRTARLTSGSTSSEGRSRSKLDWHLGSANPPSATRQRTSWDVSDVPEAVISELRSSRSFQRVGAKRRRSRNLSLGQVPTREGPRSKNSAVLRDGRVRPPRGGGEPTPRLHRLDHAGDVALAESCPISTGVDASSQPCQPCFTIGHALSLSGRPASSAGTVASSLK
jgi:hypothetical protein